VFGAGIFVGWRFKRMRVVLMLALLFVADLALATLGSATGMWGRRTIVAAVGILLPLDLAALAWSADRAILPRQWRFLLVVLLLQPLVIAVLVMPEARPLASLTLSSLPAELRPLTTLPAPAVIAFIAAYMLVAARLVTARTPLHAGALWALVATFLALGHGTGPATRLYLATGGLALLIALLEASHRLAYADGLTGLPGRRALDEALLALGDRYTVAMVDLDHFKKFNDTHGHDVGDQLLRRVGSTLERVSGGGRAFRYGGEEFAVIFPGLAAHALPHLEALRQAIASAPFTVRGRGRPDQRPEAPAPGVGARTVNVTVSIGVAESNGRGTTPHEVIKAADTALYRAKEAGRNRVCT
jgi:diguanylate cyclase (GGDEF)-like protein